MKNYLLFVFLLLSVSVFAQPKNEIGLGFLPFQNDDLGKGYEQSYYRNFSPKHAIGAKVQFYGFESDNTLDRPLNIFVDIVTRRSFINKEKMRFSAEVGISATQERFSSHNSGNVFFCGVFDLDDLNRMMMTEEGGKVTFLGFSAAIGLDFILFKSIRIGANYNFRMYKATNPAWDANFNYLRNLSLKTSVSF